MKLYGRLSAMADMVKLGESIADIGTDHGLLPIFLLEKNISPRAILTDVNKDPLAAAKSNFDLYLPGVEGDFRLGNGLEPLEKGEVDTVIIGGMGGELIGEILAKDLEKTRTYKRFILQPRTKMIELREFLHNYAFQVEAEKLVREGKFICEIIMAVPGDVKGKYKKKSFREIDLEISPLLFSNKDPLLEDYIRYKINKERYIINEIKKKGSAVSLGKKEKAKARLEELEGILREYGGGNGN